MITIQSMSLNGDGICLLKHPKSIQTVFVPYSCPGDIIANTQLPDSNPCILESYTLQTPSSDRAQPRCSHFGICGGCTYQHITYETQIKIKHTQLTDIFKSLPVPDHFDFYPSEKPYQYRNRLTLQCKNNTIGYFKRGTQEILNIEECPLAKENIEAASLKLVSLGLPPGYTGITIYENGNSIERYYHQKQSDSAAFMQVNDDVNFKIISCIRTLVTEVSSNAKLLDLFCGSGNLSFPLFDIVGKVTGIDISLTSITEAKKKADKLGLDHFQFIEMPVEKAHSIISEHARETDILLIDPPRRGLKKDAVFLSSLLIPRIIYVSCNPLSLKKDLVHFLHNGYRVRSLSGFDMFPQTPHIESLCVLEL